MSLLTNLDGVIGPTAHISVLDRGFLYGDSVYEVVRTFQGRLFGLQEHLDRLRQSADSIYMRVPWSDSQIQAEVERTLQQTHWLESYVRIVVSRGTETKVSLQPSRDLKPSLLIVISEIDPQPQLSQIGIHLQVVNRLRNDHRALSPAAKTGNYLNNILALLEAQQQGADDALLLNGQGQVTEATTSNLWIVRQGSVQTPPPSVGILQGITRHFLVQILQRHQIPYAETLLLPSDLTQAEEAFLSSSVRLLMPINRIDQMPLPHCPGPMTRWLWDELLAEMDRAVTENIPLAQSA
ncbi:branched-chain amino acid aminotransferase [Synechococcales cyanobacterium C]|uniref:Branched-chain amino acid aminotransferase n=1 Tax=Petrachloros mirabilis ULC683 TaxID=2781853 RepID=A0A8K2A078_9CYAN|nr:aminotransferase class IV [Petrachloros mirabilis]NCJ06967.1 branched-chain amino acid aminotransferase [Petrachloros mirabilis ULC683]